MRRKNEAVLCFESNDDGLPKVVRDYRDRYRAISQVLDDNPKILAAIHRDLLKLSEGDSQGREADWIELPSGRRVHPQSVNLVLRHEEAVFQYQVQQDNPSHIRISLVIRESGDRETIAGRIAAGLIKVFGEAVRVDTVFVPSIPRTRGGKVKPVVSQKQAPLSRGRD